jgi:hypothetical protein
MTRKLMSRLVGGMVATAVALAPLSASVAAQQAAAPLTQPPTASADTAAVPDGTVAFGTVRLPRSVQADGKPLPAGTYQVRLTGETADPATGATEAYARWVEFVRNGEVRGREVVSVVPQSEIQTVAKGRGPASGSSRVEMLRGDDYLRVWINRGGTHYLVHLVPA